MADPVDVSLRLLREDGTRIRGGPRAVVDYLIGIGIGRSRATLRGWALDHMRHVEAFLRAPTKAIAPVDLPDGVTRVTERGPASWLDVTQLSMDSGMAALESLAARQVAGELTPKEEIALAKLGVTTATSRAALEARGRGVVGLDAIMKLTAGLVE